MKEMLDRFKKAISSKYARFFQDLLFLYFVRFSSCFTILTRLFYLFSYYSFETLFFFAATFKKT